MNHRCGEVVPDSFSHAGSGAKADVGSGFLLQDAAINSPKINGFLFLFRLASSFEHRKKLPLHRLLYYVANGIYSGFADLLIGGAEGPAGAPVAVT